MRAKIYIEGIVQGVGFRPFIYKLAKEFNYKGYVLNDGRGVEIDIEGEDIDSFINEIYKRLPPLAKIDTIKKEILPPKNYKIFEIKHSKSTAKTTFISPDISVCEDCLAEMFDKNNRRYFYPFINCTNCGPRYTIIENIPYDRKNTSMKKFQMCEKCEKEYTNPLDRRYHAQPISCYECGPILNLKWKMEKEEREEFSYKFQVPSLEFEISSSEIKEKQESVIKIFEKISEFLKEGKIGAIKGLGGFHLVCDATNEKAVMMLRERKKRPLKPFAMMFKNIEMIEKYCKINGYEKKLITSKERPIVVAAKKKQLKGIADNIDRYGVFLPYTPVHYLLFEFIDFPIIATSANISNEPIIRSFEELEKKLGNVVDFVLDYNRDIVNACDDSVMICIDDKILTYRLSRGYAPKSFGINKKIKPKILALGANQKNTISLAFEDKVILSPHIGDLLTVDSVEYFERTIKTFKRLYSFEPDVLIGDKHPFYESVKWAKGQNLTFHQIQHHYAHILSTMFEYHLKGDFLSFSFDGTGYGDNGHIWGGEVFIANEKEYKRIFHFKEFHLIGGEKGVKNPINTAVAYLLDIDENLAKNYKPYSLIKHLKKENFPLTSSLGRIFDIAAVLGGFMDINEYEGYSGMRIENFYNGKWKMKNGEFQVAKFQIPTVSLWKIDKDEIDISELIKFVAKNRGNFELISTVFLNTLADIIVSISKSFDLPVILSGGVFQNKTLMKIILNKSDKKIYFNQKIPINDGGISLGQVMWGIENL